MYVNDVILDNIKDGHRMICHFDVIVKKSQAKIIKEIISIYYEFFYEMVKFIVKYV